jgi:hypothetical protein
MAGKPQKKPPVELRKPPPGADSFVGDEGRRFSTYTPATRLPVAPPAGLASPASDRAPGAPVDQLVPEKFDPEDDFKAMFMSDTPVSDQATGESTTSTVPPSKVRAGRRAKGTSKAVVQRVSGRQLRRTTIYFDIELARSLAVYCASADLELSEVVSLAVLQFLKKNQG